MREETARLQFAYDGSAVADGTMEVRQFAPALLAMSDLIHEANARLNGDAASVSVRVSSRFERGSFVTLLSIAQRAKEIKESLLGEDFKAAENLLKALGFARSAGTGVLQLAKRIGGKPFTKTPVAGGEIAFNISDSTINFIVSKDVADLYEDGPVREALRGVLKPLERDGIDRLEIREGDETLERVEKSDLPFFATVEDSVVEEHSGTMETLLAVETVGFREGLKWRFSDGSSSFLAKISDKVFLDEVDRGRPFAKGYILRVTLKRTSKLDSNGALRTENEIVDVLEVKPRPRQARIEFPEAGST